MIFIFLKSVCENEPFMSNQKIIQSRSLGISVTCHFKTIDHFKMAKEFGWPFQTLGGVLAMAVSKWPNKPAGHFKTFSLV